uniref:Uncharacterized protein n=1 Tax=Chromera velia CCMP2878 TaxID=1169474 RepID=A0A0G4HFX3_9ALVE|mmetsp:Transcript_23856/g.46865  ORF Transcript_23856/g.46865 Transcript_23856/m.46865 type:complete len:92 (+) Transcript_23856:113-388(+)|eukprot:Cvel_27023.t1-p1 / transcript=Cvel_27023.t1 / gene=Cvel_27023 / organism=Chromera_velia_CCMP2878 / gene_product=hypothetical protein / transcript_product=hypothetical protein / location=Cvel_scaffold3305:7552-8912(+) / protein_length=91 / sequence_SO=supercontig / SO=protein_coding / is_pseudo=false
MSGSPGFYFSSPDLAAVQNLSMASVPAPPARYQVPATLGNMNNLTDQYYAVATQPMLGAPQQQQQYPNYGPNYHQGGQMREAPKSKGCGCS